MPGRTPYRSTTASLTYTPICPAGTGSAGPVRGSTWAGSVPSGRLSTVRAGRAALSARARRARAVNTLTAVDGTWQGDNTDPAPTDGQERSIRIAKETGSVVAEVGMIPNQPLTFTLDLRGGQLMQLLLALTGVPS